MQVNRISFNTNYNNLNRFNRYTTNNSVRTSQNPVFEGKKTSFIQKGVKKSLEKLSSVKLSENELLEFVKGEKPNTVNEFYVSGKTKYLQKIKEYDPKTGSLVKVSWFENSGKSLDHIYEYDPITKIRTKSSSFSDDGKTLHVVTEYDRITGKITKATRFRDDGQTVRSVNIYDPETARIVKTTRYREDGKLINSENFYDAQSGKRIKTLEYAKDGKNPEVLLELDIKTDKLLRATYFRPGGNKIDKVYDYATEYDRAPVQNYSLWHSFTPGYVLKRESRFREDGKTLSKVIEFNPQTQLKSKEILYGEDGKTVKSITSYNSKFNEELSTVYFKEDGRTIDRIDYPGE